MGLFDRFQKKKSVMGRTLALMELDLPDIRDLPSDEDFITALDGHISGKDPRSLTAPERAFSLAMGAAQDVGEGGFEAWYLDRGDESARWTPGALAELGFPQAADILRQALALLPEPDGDGDRRLERLQALGAGGLRELRGLSRAFNGSLGGFAARCRGYVLEKWEYFS